MLTKCLENGSRHGYSRQWYDNAQLKSKGKYLFGKKHEVWFEYFPNGQISNKISYDDGTPNGLIVSWYSNGQQKEKGSVIKESSEASLSFYTKKRDMDKVVYKRTKERKRIIC